jgi:hypothetical protein
MNTCLLYKNKNLISIILKNFLLKNSTFDGKGDRPLMVGISQ